VKVPMHYELRLSNTASGVGYFACIPSGDLSLAEGLAYLGQCPFDDFMHNYLLELAGEEDRERLRQIADDAHNASVVSALVCEAALTFPRLASLKAYFNRQRMKALLAHTPLITIKSSLLDDQELHHAWIRAFDSVINEHRPIPSPASTGLPLLFPEEDSGPDPAVAVHVREILDRPAFRSSVAAELMPSAEETARRAVERLQAVDAFVGGEMKHGSSLSPHAFYRRWRLSLSVRNGRHDYTVSGIQTSWGKGLTPEAARASCLMETIERLSSFASFGPEGVVGRTREVLLVHEAFSRLRQDGRTALDPNSLGLEVPYDDEPLHWLEATERTASGSNSLLIPAQTVFLFANLDEINLFSGLGSTGLASGNTIEQAKVNALLEVIERDCEATTLYDPSLCFRVSSDDPNVAGLLSDFRRKGIWVRFQDLASGMGVPCYKCFVVDSAGQVVKGTGAHLDGKKALLSALTETPYPYPVSRPSSPCPEGLPTLRLEDLPVYSSESPARDLGILEALITANGWRILYVDLTRKDIGIPVVKALIPGMELMADFDRYSRVSRRLFANYLRAAGSAGKPV